MMRPDDISPLFHLTGAFNCKIDDLEMSQNLIAPSAWMLAIINHKPNCVIEIGTQKGGLSSLLSRCTTYVGAEFHTFDVHSGGNYNRYPLYGNSTFHNTDCFSEKGRAFIAEKLTHGGKCFLLCDGGNKPKEFNEFSAYLTKGSTIGAHDWIDETIYDYSPTFWGCCETHSHQLKDACEKHKLAKFEEKWFAYSAWFVRQKI